MSLFLLLRSWPACIGSLIWVVCLMGDKWPDSWCFLKWFFHDLFQMHALFFLSFFCKRFVYDKVVQSYSITDTTSASNISRFILSEKSDFSMVNKMAITVYIFSMHVGTTLTVDEILQPTYMNCFTDFWGLPFREKFSTIFIKNSGTLFYLSSDWD